MSHQRDMLALLLAQMKDHALVFLDAQGLVTAWLGGAENILGYKEAEVLGRSISLIFTGSDTTMGLDLHEMRVARENGYSEDDRWHVRRDGAKVWISGSLTVLKDEAGAVVGYAKIMRDRTDWRGQIDSLNNRAKMWEETLEARNTYIARLSHEIRNSLSPLRSGVELIRRGARSEHLDFTLALLDRQLNLLVRMSQDLAAVRERGALAFELSLYQINLNEHLVQCVASLHAQAQARRQSLKCLVPDGVVRIVVDPQRLQQIVHNLLSNSLKYTDEGGRIVLRMLTEGDEAVIRVADSGKGIEPDLLPLIFSGLSKEGPRDPEGGMGVGLHIVRDLVHAHRGTVEVRSEGAGKGAEFTVRLPLPAPA
jgi:PAS domain S-box-containing protein